MKTFIKILVGVFLSVGLAFASNVKQNDLSFAFNTIKSSEVVVLNKTEMKKIKGAGWFKHLRHSIKKAFKKIRHSIRKIPKWKRIRLALQLVGAVGFIYTGGTIYPTFQGVGFSVAW